MCPRSGDHRAVSNNALKTPFFWRSPRTEKSCSPWLEVWIKEKAPKAKDVNLQAGSGASVRGRKPPRRPIKRGQFLLTGASKLRILKYSQAGKHAPAIYPCFLCPPGCFTSFMSCVTVPNVRTPFSIAPNRSVIFA